ncbi:MAG: DUF2235 domain-containing protein [Pseudomonadota bacterium]|nr:DUF2235 domain-containing protein [Pseudomonadota bacterium]
MERLTNIKRLIDILQMTCCIASVTFFIGYASLSGADDEKKVLPIKKQTHTLSGDADKHKSMFVFLDGTANDPKSGTNVWRLYEMLLKNNDPQMTAIYIEGVGSVRDKPISGAALGRGMEERILMGYEFIAKNYNSGDDIYIIGFSRGAHQARSLAGLLSYAGVPITSRGERDYLIETANKIIELTKKKSDQDFADKWVSWSPGQASLLASEIKEKLQLEMQTAEITFLGVWDTVPGSSLKDYGYCKEEKGFVKNYLYWLIPGIDKGERYKSDSYPAIRDIAHAVSLDEKRSKFAPLLLCPAINPEYTRISEVWFPGAHADVGGGYQDSDELPSISLRWMIDLLEESYEFNNIPPEVEENAKGLAHWSIKDFPANVGSDCIDRHIPANANIHTSFSERKNSSPVPIRMEGMVKSLNYPIKCSTIDTLN